MTENKALPILSHFNKNVIIGILALKVISSVADKLVLPLIDAYLMDSRTFSSYNLSIDKDSKKILCIKSKKEENSFVEIGIGDIIKDLIIFIVLAGLIYYIF